MRRKTLIDSRLAVFSLVTLIPGTRGITKIKAFVRGYSSVVGKWFKMAKFKFTPEDKQKIKEAVAAMEKESSSEIVPYFAQSSDDYDEARWFGATVFLGIGLVLQATLSYLWLLPTGISPMEIAVYLLIVGFLGFIIPTLFPVTRLLFIGKNRAMERVNERAIEVFLEEEVFSTRNRTGILFYISNLERKVVVIGDSGINARVKQQDWDEIVGIIVQGIKKKEVAHGIVKAIDACKHLLLAHGFTMRKDDTNELPDDLRVEE